jgi:hypothetical protein
MTITAIRDASERRICAAVVRRALAAGYFVSVSDGELVTLRKSRDEAAIFDAMATTDADNLNIHRADGVRLGSVVLIYGNGEDVISDYSWAAATDGAAQAMDRLCEAD